MWSLYLAAGDAKAVTEPAEAHGGTVAVPTTGAVFKVRAV